MDTPHCETLSLKGDLWPTHFDAYHHSNTTIVTKTFNVSECKFYNFSFSVSLLNLNFEVATREANEWVKAESEKKYNVRLYIYVCICRIISLKSVTLFVVAT